MEFLFIFTTCKESTQNKLCWIKRDIPPKRENINTKMMYLQESLIWASTTSASWRGETKTNISCEWRADPSYCDLLHWTNHKKQKEICIFFLPEMFVLLRTFFGASPHSNCVASVNAPFSHSFKHRGFCFF